MGRPLIIDGVARGPRGKLGPGSIGGRTRSFGAISAIYVVPAESRTPVGDAQDYAAQAHSRVIVQYRESAKLLAFIDALMGPLQSIENALVQIPLFDDPNLASGVNLDVTGDLVGQSRAIQSGAFVLDDAAYRLLIRARIAKNSSHGSGPEIVAMLAYVFQTQIRFEDLGGMGIRFAMGRVPTALEIALLHSDILPRPMGVEISGEWFDLTNFFGFSDQAGAYPFGENNAGPPPGGRFAELF